MLEKERAMVSGECGDCHVPHITIEDIYICKPCSLVLCTKCYVDHVIDVHGWGKKRKWSARGRDKRLNK